MPLVLIVDDSPTEVHVLQQFLKRLELTLGATAIVQAGLDVRLGLILERLEVQHLGDREADHGKPTGTGARQRGQ